MINWTQINPLNLTSHFDEHWKVVQGAASNSDIRELKLLINMNHVMYSLHLKVIIMFESHVWKFFFK